MQLRGSRNGLVGAAATLAVAGSVMLGIGVLSMADDNPAGEAGAAPSPSAPAVSTEVTDEVTNPVAGPTAIDPDLSLGTSTPPQQPDLVPTRVRIPSLQVDAGVIDLGLNPDRTLEVPQDIAVTGWYTGRSVPGEAGPSVVVGHVDSAVAGAGVFFNLRQLEKGDTIEVERSDGSVAEFLVTSLVSVEKDEFPTEQVYGSTEQPTLRLITCGGSFDKDARSYVGNVIVYAEHRGNREPANLKS